MNEETVISVLPPIRPTVWEVVIGFIARLINKILGPGEQQTYSYPRQSEFEKAHKMIRMAQNYNEPYEDVVRRIREESSRYLAFKKNPEPIGKVILNVKHVDSKQAYQRQYEVRDPDEGKASVSYTHRRSPDIVLEFQLHDKNDQPLFSIARTYSNWIGCREMDLGGDRVFYLNMVEDEMTDRVVVQAGFKAKHAAMPVFTARDTSDTLTHPDNATSSWPLNRMVLVGSTQVIAVVLCLSIFSMFKVFANSKSPVEESGATPIAAESATNVSSQQVTGIVWANLTVDVDSNLAFGGTTGPRNDRGTSRSSQAAHINTFAISVHGTSLDESVRCGRELLNRIQKGINGELNNKASDESLKDSNCGNRVKFVWSFEPIERKPTNFFFPLGEEKRSVFDNAFEGGQQEFVGGPDDIAKFLFRIINGDPDPTPGPDDKRDEVAMTE